MIIDRHKRKLKNLQQRESDLRKQRADILIYLRETKTEIGRMEQLIAEHDQQPATPPKLKPQPVTISTAPQPIAGNEFPGGYVRAQRTAGKFEVHVMVGDPAMKLLSIADDKLTLAKRRAALELKQLLSIECSCRHLGVTDGIINSARQVLGA